METNYINESEVRDKLVKECRAINQSLRMSVLEKEKEYGIGLYVGGLTLLMCSEKMDLETNLKNILAVFSCNYAESMFFQLDNIKKMETLSLVQEYLRSCGLEDDFSLYKQMRQKSQKTSQAKNPFMKEPLITENLSIKSISDKKDHSQST